VAFTFPDVVIFSQSPTEMHLDASGRLHNSEGAAVLFEDGFGVWAIHGVRLPRWIIEEPQKITVGKIKSEHNAEIRRVMIERYGEAKYLLDSGAREIHRDDFGILYRQEMEGDEPLVMVKVVNATPEPDGTFKDYFLRVAPDLRPLLAGNKLGEPQAMTAHNAVASTFGKRGEEYAPCVET
jgi:hypothetical protein